MERSLAAGTAILLLLALFGCMAECQYFDSINSEEEQNAAIPAERYKRTIARFELSGTSEVAPQGIETNCMGTFIAGNASITSARCFNSSHLTRPIKLDVLFGDGTIRPNESAKVFLYSKHKHNQYNSNKNGRFDLAIVIFARQIYSEVPMGIDSELVECAEELEMYGFENGTFSMIWTEVVAFDKRFLGVKNGDATCFGNPGSPLIRDHGLLGILSSGYSTDPVEGCQATKRVIRLRTGKIRRFIAENVPTARFY